MKKLVKNLITGLMLTTAINAGAEVGSSYNTIYAAERDGFIVEVMCNLKVVQSNFRGSHPIGHTVKIAVGKEENTILGFTHFKEDGWVYRSIFTGEKSYIMKYIQSSRVGSSTSESWRIYTDKAYLYYIEQYGDSEKYGLVVATGKCDWFNEK